MEIALQAVQVSAGLSEPDPVWIGIKRRLRRAALPLEEKKLLLRRFHDLQENAGDDRESTRMRSTMLQLISLRETQRNYSASPLQWDRENRQFDAFAEKLERSATSRGRASSSPYA